MGKVMDSGAEMACVFIFESLAREVESRNRGRQFSFHGVSFEVPVADGRSRRIERQTRRLNLRFTRRGRWRFDHCRVSYFPGMTML